MGQRIDGVHDCDPDSQLLQKGGPKKQEVTHMVIELNVMCQISTLDVVFYIEQKLQKFSH